MPILQATNLTIENVTRVWNASSVSELTINVNTYVFGGVYFFIMLWLLWFVLFTILQRRENQLMPNLLISGGIVSVISILVRFVYIADSGVWKGLLTESQMWLFPVITVVIAMIAWMTKED